MKLYNEDSSHIKIIMTTEHTGSVEIKLNIPFNLVPHESVCSASYSGKALWGVMKDIINCAIQWKQCNFKFYLQWFPSDPLSTCQEILRYLMIKLYLKNSRNIKLLSENLKQWKAEWNLIMGQLFVISFHII
jgi:hypothetical protein